MQNLFSHKREKKERSVHQDYIDFENKVIGFEDLSKESQSYIKQIKKEYRSFLNGEIDYNSLSQDAKWKANNKVSRAYMRKVISKTNMKINGLLNGIWEASNPNNKDTYKKTEYLSKNNNMINQSFFDLTSVETHSDYLGIYGLYVLNEYKKDILHEYDNIRKGTKSSSIENFLGAVEVVKEKFDNLIYNQTIKYSEIKNLTSKLTVADANKILSNLPEKSQQACIDNCEYRWLLNENPSTNITNQETQVVNTKKYYDGPFGNPITFKDGNYYTSDNSIYNGDIFQLNTDVNDGDGFIYVDTVGLQDKDLPEK